MSDMHLLTLAMPDDEHPADSWQRTFKHEETYILDSNSLEKDDSPSSVSSRQVLSASIKLNC